MAYIYDPTDKSITNETYAAPEVRQRGTVVSSPDYQPGQVAATTPTPAAPTDVTQQPVGELFGGALSYSQSPDEKAIQDAQNRLLGAYPTEAPNFAKVQKDTISMFQGQIDALNRAATQKKAEIATNLRPVFENRLGSDASIQARRGLLGSDFGAGQTGRVTSANQNELQSNYNVVDAETNSAVQGLMGQATQFAREDYDKKVNAYRQGAEATVSYLKERAETRKNNAANIVKAALLNGIDLSDPNSKGDLAKLAAQLGVSVSDLLTSYKEQKGEAEAAAAKAAKEGQTILSEGQIVIDANGNVVARGANKPVTLSEGSIIINSDGSIVKNPKTYTPESPLDQAYKLAQIEKIKNDIANGGDANKVLSPTEAQSLGVPYGTTQAQAMALGITPQKPATDAQSQASAYATRVQQSGGILDTLSSDIAKYNILGFSAQRKLPNNLKSGEVQQYEQAASNFINAVLRRESGAAIAQSEFDNAYKQYLPYPGDSEEVLKQKKQNRDTVLNGLIQSAGPAYNSGSGGNDDPLGIKSGFSSDLGKSKNGPLGLDSFKQSLVQQESGGNYKAVGMATSYGKALGKYQIIPKFHFGKIGLDPSNPQHQMAFLNNPGLQDKLFGKIIDGLYQHYKGDLRKIAAAYYGGDAAARIVGTKAADRPQGKAPSINQYVRSVLGRIG